MRIVAGEFKGRKLKLPQGSELRPTAELVREAIFSAIDAKHNLDEFIAIDLFSGSGAMGMEALSRGAKYCLFVEKNPKLAKSIVETLQEWGVDKRAKIFSKDVYKFLSGLKLELEQLSNSTRTLFLIDPPYTEHPGYELLDSIKQADLISPGSIIIYGMPTTLSLTEEELNSLKFSELKSKTYGQTRIIHLTF